MVLIFLKFPLNHHFEHDTPIIYPIHNYPIPNCNPIIISNTTATYQQYHVIIDGRQYPTPNSTALQLLKHSLNFTCLNLNANVKRILAWNPFFGDYGYGMGVGWRQPFVERGCPVANCELVSSQDNRQPLDHFHLVLVHMRDSFRPIPKVRPAKQKWVFVLYEAPTNSAERRDFDEFDGIFNATSTYTHDSDFSCNKDVLEWIRSSSFNRFTRFNEEVALEAIERREMAAAALISNCGASSRRIEYIREIQKYIRVDVFGGCGKECPKSVGNATRDCMEVLSRKYKFYLAFENSICRDYITEKFFRQLNHYIIPVTLGGGPYHIYVILFLLIITNYFKPNN
jgi:alpha-1,3-fucosyltransferase